MSDQLTIQQFGQMIKQKYPDYAGYSDEEIGQRMLAKYPQYQYRIQPPSPQQQAEAIASRKSTPEFLSDPTASLRQAQEAQLQRLPVGLGMLAATGLAGEAAPALIANPAVREVVKKALPYAIGSAVGLR